MKDIKNSLLMQLVALFAIIFVVNAFPMRMTPGGVARAKKFFATNRAGVVKQVDLKPIMPQEQLFTQKDALQGLVKNIWESCLKTLDTKFSDLSEQNQYDNNIISIKWNFEKQPRTDDNVAFINKTVQDVIEKTSMLSINFDQQTKTTQEQALKDLLKRIITNVFVEVLLQDISTSLDWCSCTAEYKRITLAVLLINEIREKFSNKNQQIVYTSFASGRLLQDYAVLSELLLSHTNLLVNLIDLEYPDIPALAKKDLSEEAPHDLHMIEMQSKQMRANTIDSFKIKMAQVISTRDAGINYHFDTRSYQNAYDYIARVQQNSDEKSNVLILVDPDVGSFGMADFPSLANVINVWIDQEKIPVFTIYLPRHHGTQLYQAIKIANKPLTVPSKVMQYLHNQLLSLIVHTGSSKHYTPHLVKAFLDKAVIDGPIADESLTNNFPKLMQMRSNLKKQSYREDNILQPLTPIKLGDMPVLLSWGTDAHISYQDLVWDALAPNAIVYQLYAIDPINDEDENNRIIKIDPEIYKKSDVITPNSGRDSSSVKHQDDFQKDDSVAESSAEADAQYKRIL